MTGTAASLVLRELTVDDEAEALRAQHELAADDFGFLLNTEDGEPWPAYVQRLADIRRGVVPPALVPATFLVAEVDGQLVGRVSVRHELNELLADRGGHIGYGVRPAFRRRGYATEILRQALLVAASVGVTDALLICDDDNAASAATIERCGGVLHEVATIDDPAHPVIRRYLVPTGGRPG